MVDEMTQQEIQKLKDLTEKYKSILSQSAKKSFEEWEIKKNKVIKALRFNEELDTVITYATVLETTALNFHNRAGFGNKTREQLINTKGNTALISQILALYERADDFRDEYKVAFKKFEKEYLRQNPKR